MWVKSYYYNVYIPCYSKFYLHYAPCYSTTILPITSYGYIFPQSPTQHHSQYYFFLWCYICICFAFVGRNIYSLRGYKYTIKRIQWPAKDRQLLTCMQTTFFMIMNSIMNWSPSSKVKVKYLRTKMTNGRAVSRLCMIFQDTRVSKWWWPFLITLS